MNHNRFSRSYFCRVLFFVSILMGLFSVGVDARPPDLEHKWVQAIDSIADSLRLIGTALLSDPKNNLAVIEERHGTRQWTFHEGDRAGDIIIKKIRRNHIVIDAGNGDEIVKMNGSLVESSKAPAAQAPVPSFTPTYRAGSRQRHFRIDRAMVESAFAKPELVLDQVDIKPGRLFARKTGFRIAAFDVGSVFNKLGLRRGDLVLKLNDQAIAGPEEAASFFETIRRGGDVSLTVRRRARTYHIHLSIQ